ncbi:MAG: hypothetical protein L0Z07_06750 [Planctomycetes bacterium]|nr:hypothetical protein [Planctomycetota bacterium]
MSLKPHIIRLRGPWQLEPIARFLSRPDGTLLPGLHGLPSPVRATLPANWSILFGHEFLGRVRYGRTFHLPTGLEPHERVWLVVEPPRSHGIVRLNGLPLGEIRLGDPAGRFEITTLLTPRNAKRWLLPRPLVAPSLLPLPLGEGRGEGNSRSDPRPNPLPTNLRSVPGEGIHLEIDVTHPLLDENGHPVDDDGVFVPGGLVGEVRLVIEERPS